jgi:hypothetical protein
MGLDHGLRRGADLKDWDHKNEEYDVYRARREEIELITWRKENHFHRWFVKNVQKGIDDCEDYVVTLAQLRAFVDVVRRVRDGSKLQPGIVTEGWTWTAQTGKVPNQRQGQVLADSEFAESLLPTQAGFFFGGTDYDEWYYKSLDQALEALEPVLEKASDDDVFTYWSSW